MQAEDLPLVVLGRRFEVARIRLETRMTHLNGTAPSLAAVIVMAWPVATAAQTTPGSAVTLAPHRAVYDIKLDRAASGSGVVDASGRMVYELTGSACDGYTQNMRFVTRMTSGEGSSQLNDLRSSSFEDSTGKAFRFNSNSYKNDQLADTTQGDATREPQGIRVELTRPNKKTVNLSSGVYFPVQHSVALIAAARAGKSIFIADLYDGSEKGEKVYSTTSAIGRRIAPGVNKSPVSLKNGDVLDKQAYWPVAISYFEPGSEKRDAVPSYELSFRFFENGVSTRLLINYGEFAIRGELKELVFLDAPKCEGPATSGKAMPGKR
jgi:EipB-like